MDILSISIIIVASLLIVSILLQQRGAALGSGFGGEGNIYSTLRGFEKILFYMSSFFAGAFIFLSLLKLIL
ncbi:hypothetical protein HRbin34_00539 [bacterium HR34]|nr:hypothetical protein HRbin34_00539 [bacterium HR34]